MVKMEPYPLCLWGSAPSPKISFFVIARESLVRLHSWSTATETCCIKCQMCTQSKGQRESFFYSRDENESFSYSISHIETRPRISDTLSRASRRDREKIFSNPAHRDEIEIYFLHSQASRLEREFPWSNLGFRDENENSKSCHLSLNSGLNGLTILRAISGRLLYKMQGICLDVLPFWSDPVMFS